MLEYKDQEIILSIRVLDTGIVKQMDGENTILVRTVLAALL